jgi:hypothetical protein
MGGMKRSFAERHMLYSLEVAGYGFLALNKRMKDAGFRYVPETTYNMNMRNEVRLFKARPELLTVFAESPVKYGDWSTAWRQARDSQ